MDKLRALKMLLTVIEAGSLSAAATQERVSAATALRLMAGLERELGARLVQRTSRKMSLSEDAQLRVHDTTPAAGTPAGGG